MPKTREKSLERLKRKLKRISRELERKTSRARSRSRSPRPHASDSNGHRDRSQELLDSHEVIDCNDQSLEQHSNLAPDCEVDAPTAVPLSQTPVELTETEVESEISEEILALLGEAPEEVAYGPDLLPQLCSRWQVIIKKGLDREEKIKLMKKYPPPNNFKILNAPKLNPETQAAAGETVVKRDKAIEAKQREVSCALSALGLVLNKLCKAKSLPGSDEIITIISDSARLLCDYNHCESSIRKQFILTGLDNKTARDAVKDAETDEWLFGENLFEKLKASKAIERSSKDLKSKPKKQTYTNNLNYKGPINSVYKPKQGQRPHFPKKQTGSTPMKPYQPKPRYNQRQSNYSRRQ